MEAIQLSDLWTAAAVLIGFQIAAFTWRINREIEMEGEDETTWVTLADGLVGVSFLVVVIGVFAAPLKGLISAETAAKLLGVGLFIFAAHAFVLIGHYNLYCSWDKTSTRGRVTKQEWVAFIVTAILVISGALWILI